MNKLSLISQDSSDQIFDVSSGILSTLASRQSFADAVAKERCLGRLLKLLVRVNAYEASSHDEGSNLEPKSERVAKLWPVLAALTSTPSIATQVLSGATWIELLGVLIGYRSFTKARSARVGAAQSISRLLWDPVIGSQTGAFEQ